MSYEELKNYLQDRMKISFEYNYQPVMIKQLNENDGKCTKQEIQEELHRSNPQYPAEHFKKFPFEILVKNNIVELIDDLYFLKSFKTYENDDEKINSITGYCDQLIRVCNDINTLRNFENKVDKVQLQVLEEILRLRGKDRTAQQMGWSNNGSAFLELNKIDKPFLIHPLSCGGTYTPAHSKYAQAIFLSPDTKWGKEIDQNSKTLKINYDYGDSLGRQHTRHVKEMTACKQLGLPVGVFFRLKDTKYRCLGLGRIKSINENNFVIESFGITDEESIKLKEDVVRDYARYYEKTHKEKAFIDHHPVNWDELEEELKPIEESSIKSSKIHTSKEQLSYLIHEGSQGQWVLPEFQREFKWKMEDARDLLESVVRGYYIGTVLLWNVSDDAIRSKMNTYPIEGVEKKSPNFTKIILDGQQRITSLNYSINSPKIGKHHPGYFYIDLQGYLKDDEEQIVVANKNELEEKDTFERLLFPLKYTENLGEWKKPCKNFLKSQGVSSETIEKINDGLDDLVHKIKSYEIATINLEVEHDVVVNVFEKVNTTGKPLQVFELLNNRLTVKGINLTRTLLPDTLEKYPKIKIFDDSLKTEIAKYIMESISLSYSNLKSCKRKDILEMYSEGEKLKNNPWTPEKFVGMWKNISNFLNLAIEKLENVESGFGLPHPKELPYEPMLPVLTSLIQQTSENFENEHDCDDKITRWYWASIFDQRYSQGVDGTKTSDYKLMVEWFKNDKSIPKFITKFENSYQTKIPFHDIDSHSSASYRGVMCLIKKTGATDPRIVYDQTKKEHMDHIFPQSQMKKFGDLRNSILNMTWLTSITNITKSKIMPKEYYSKILKDVFDNDESELRKVLSSHLINDKAYDHLMENEFEEFIEERKKEILKTIAHEIDVEYVEETNFPQKMSEKTEYGNTAILRNTLRECKKEIFWCSPYFSIADQDEIYGIRDKLNVKKIRILTSSIKADEILKSKFKHFRNEMKDNHGIECEMRVMNKKILDIQHKRYLKDGNRCWSFVDVNTAQRKKNDSVQELSKAQWPSDIETWWNESFDIMMIGSNSKLDI